MGNYKLEYGNGNWLTGVGGSVMTATDLDTGIVEPILLKNGRGSEKTAIDKNGKLYTVKPYENAVTYIDGVAKHNTEPQATNYASDNTDLITGTFVGAIYVEDVESPTGEMNAIKVDFPLDSDYYRVLLSGIPASHPKYGLSFYVKSDTPHVFRLGANDTGSGMRYSDDFTSTNEWVRYTWVQGTGASLSQFRLYSREDDAQLQIAFPQFELDRVTSTIFTNGATATRLADTGIETPDLSKYTTDFKEMEFVIKPIPRGDEWNDSITFKSSDGLIYVTVIWRQLGTLFFRWYDGGGVNQIFMPNVINVDEFSKININWKTFEVRLNDVIVGSDPVGVFNPSKNMGVVVLGTQSTATSSVILESITLK